MAIPAWSPGRFARRRPYLLARNRMVRATRDLFEARGLIEVETPALQVSPGLEPALNAFETVLERPDGTKVPRYLHTSPEYAMKKLLAAGEPAIFQLAKVFRNGERADTHHPEFTMLEWYRAGAPYHALIEDAQALLNTVAAAGQGFFSRGHMRAEAGQPFEIVTVEELFARLGIDLIALMGNIPAFRQAAADLSVRTDDGDSWDDVFFRIFLEKIEPGLGQGRPTVVTDYPIHMAALARPKPEAPHLAERFEIYVCGLELANAFGELTDAEEQRRRFAIDRAQRQAGGRDPYPVDEDFLAAIAHMPPASGIALGFDRLVMLATGAQSIDDVLWLPVAGD